jgi:hypothetical protein
MTCRRQLLLDALSNRLAVSFAEGKDVCKKGKSCGAACINRDDDCIIDFDVDLNAALNNSRRFIQKMKESGALTSEQAEDLRKEVENPSQYRGNTSRVKAFREFGEMLKKGEVTEDEKDFVAKLILSTTLVPGQDRNAARVLSYDQVDSILTRGDLRGMEAAYKASFVNGKFDPSVPGAMGQQIEKLLTHKISDKVAELGYNMLDPKVRAAIDKAGSVNQMFAGYDEKGNVIYSSAPTKERGIFLVKRWGEQGGLDPYDRSPIDIRNAEPEHMVAYKHAQAKGGGGGDQPDNLMWASSRTNNNKAGAGDNFTEWRESLESSKARGKDEYDSKIYNPAVADAQSAKGKKANAPTDLKVALDAASPQQRANTMKALLLTYGEEARYLLRAAGVGWQHKDRDLDHRQGGKPAFMDMDIPKLPGFGVKPSVAVMVALSAVEPEKRKFLLESIEGLRKARIFTDKEVESVRGDNEARLRLKKQKSSEYADDLTRTLESYVPSLGSLL